MTTTTRDRRPGLADPVYTIEHVAALLHLSVDRARHYTKGDFPAARQLGSRLLWDRHEVLDWFRGLSPQPRTEHTRNRGTSQTAPVAQLQVRTTKAYRPRTPRGVR